MSEPIKVEAGETYVITSRDTLTMQQAQQIRDEWSARTGAKAIILSGGLRLQMNDEYVARDAFVAAIADALDANHHLLGSPIYDVDRTGMAQAVANLIDARGWGVVAVPS